MLLNINTNNQELTINLNNVTQISKAGDNTIFYFIDTEDTIKIHIPYNKVISHLMSYNYKVTALHHDDNPNNHILT